MCTITLSAGIVSIFIVPESITNARSINPQPCLLILGCLYKMIHIHPFGVRREVTASSSATEFIEASLDPRDSRANFSAFHLSLLVVKTFVIIVKITIIMMLMILMIIILMIIELITMRMMIIKSTIVIIILIMIIKNYKKKTMIIIITIITIVNNNNTI